VCSGMGRGREVEKEEGTPRLTERSVRCGNVCDVGRDEDRG